MEDVVTCFVRPLLPTLLHLILPPPLPPALLHLVLTEMEESVLSVPKYRLACFFFLQQAPDGAEAAASVSTLMSDKFPLFFSPSN